MLPYYLDRQPAKSFGEIYLETTEKPPTTIAPDAKAVKDLADRLKKADPAAFIPQVDNLLVAARFHYVNGDWCNLLQDVRDVLSSKATNAEIADYILWRVDHFDWFAVPPPQPDSYIYPPVTKDIVGTEKALELEKRATQAPAELRPHWLYLRGALGFRLGDRGEAKKWFDRVCAEFPTSPRSEFALFMSARCELAQSFAQLWDETDDWKLSPADREKKQQARDVALQEHRSNTELLFKNYLQKYPSGRLVADTYGWLGALHYGHGNNAAALSDYINQVRASGHPEIKKSALFMCEDILANATVMDRDIFDLVAHNPVIAQGTTYLALNRATASSDNSWGESDTQEVADAKKWRQSVLPQIAIAVAANKDTYQKNPWPPRYLAMLAQAASAAGNQKDALKLSSVPTKELEGSDDLLLARAIAFQRAGQPTNAIATYRKLLASFPQSQLAEGAQLKLALALADHHEAGRSVIELKKLREIVSKKSDPTQGYDTVYPPSVNQLSMTDSFVFRDISGAEIDEIDQLLDTLYNFAPTRELATCLDSTAKDQSFQMEIQSVLAERYLAVEDFSSAKEVMSPAVYQSQAAELERLTLAAAQVREPAEKAALINQLGDAWAAARGYLLSSPLDDQNALHIFESNTDQAGLRRRENGLALGYRDANTNLEDRDELRHAARWWMRAAQAVPGTQLAASARWKALAAIPDIASHSDFAFIRAVETDERAISHQLYDKLRSECPESVEAKKYAAYWSFPLPQKRPEVNFISFDAFNQGSEANSIGLMGYTNLDYGAFGITHDFNNDSENGGNYQDASKIHDRILALRDQGATGDTQGLIKEVEDIRREARADDLGSRYSNFLDDLDLFLHEPNLTVPAIKAYIDLRLTFNCFLPQETSSFPYDADSPQGIAVYQILGNDALKPYPEYVDFLRAVEDGKHLINIQMKDIDKDGTPLTISTWDYQALEKNMAAFLAKYPTGAKREAAMLVWARAIRWQMTPLYTSIAVNNQQMTMKTYWREKLDSKRLLAALDLYDREYPNGRYAAEIRDWRAYAVWQTHDWKQALDLTLQNLDDKSHPDLQPIAALRLANIFADLAKEQYRSDLLDAIRKNPKATQLLQKYVGAIWTNKDHPLRYLGDYLADQFGFPHPQPPPVTPNPNT